MNARTDKAALARADVQLLPLAALRPSDTHIQQLRRKRFNEAALRELAESMAKVGQLQPIVVRRVEVGLVVRRGGDGVVEDGKEYEIVLGERRWRALQIAGAGTIEAKVRELDDGQVLEAQLIENLQREDLHPLEEAEGYRELMELQQIRKEDLGARLGKSRSWVYSRLKLLDLAPAVRESLEAGRIDVSRALVLSRLCDDEAQVKALAIAEDRLNDEPGADYTHSVRGLQEAIEEGDLAIDLADAPFPLDDASLHPIACTACEWRSGSVDPAAGNPNVCTGPRGCHDAKIVTFHKRLVDEAVAAGRPVLRGADAKAVVKGHGNYVGFVDLAARCPYDEFPEAEPHHDADDEVWQDYHDRSRQWQERTYRDLLQGEDLPVTLLEAKKGQLAQLVPFKDAARILQARHQIKLPAFIAAPDGQKKAGTARENYKEQIARQQAEQKKLEEAANAESAIRLAILKAIAAAKPAGELKGGELWAVASCFLDNWSVRESLKNAGIKLPTGASKDTEILATLRLAIAALDVHVNSYGRQEPPTALLALAKACKVDAAKIRKDLEAKASGAATPAAAPAAKKAAPKKKGSPK